MSPFFESFARANPIAAARHGYAPPADLEDWPDDIGLDDGQGLRRFDHLLATAAVSATAPHG